MNLFYLDKLQVYNNDLNLLFINYYLFKFIISLKDNKKYN